MGRVAGVVVGILFASALYLDGVRDLLLTIFVGASWAIAVWLTIRNRRTLKDAGDVWSVLLVVLTVGVAFFGNTRRTADPREPENRSWNTGYGHRLGGCWGWNRNSTIE